MTNLTFLSKISIIKLNVAWTDIGNKSDSKNAQKNLIKLFSKKRLDPRRTGTMTIQT